MKKFLLFILAIIISFIPAHFAVSTTLLTISFPYTLDIYRTKLSPDKTIIKFTLVHLQHGDE